MLKTDSESLNTIVKQNDMIIEQNNRIIHHLEKMVDYLHSNNNALVRLDIFMETITERLIEKL